MWLHIDGHFIADGVGANVMLQIWPDPNAARVFEKSMASYGSVWRHPDPRSNDALGLQELRALFQLNISQQRRSLGPRGYVHFDYLDNPHFNALAWSSESYDFVAVYSGAFLHLYRLFFCFLSDPNVLPSLGEAWTEAVDPLVLEAISGREPLSRAMQHPTDDLRHRAAQNFALVACLLILNHEIGHIAHCHPHFMKKHFGVNALEELPLTPRSTEQYQLMRAFEWEADDYAAVVTYLVTQRIRGLFGGIENISTDYILSVAAFMLFLYMHRHSGGPFDAESATHPAPRDRWLWMMHEIQNHERCKAFKPNGEDMGRGIRDVTEFWRRNGLIGESELSTAITWENDITHRFNEARKALREVMAELSAIESVRNEQGLAWYDSNQVAANAFSHEALEHIRRGAVVRPPRDPRHGS